MFALYRKELNSFFGSPVAYVVLGIFLTANALFLWIWPDTNLLDNGYADLTPFFQQAPLFFLLLIPGITMRMFAEEINTGTLEILMTRPISLFGIVLGKFYAALTLVALALLPTLIYPLALNALAENGVGMETGALAGSYLGLFFLAAVYAAAGIFASSLVSNQLISLLLGMVLCAFLSLGLPAIASLPILSAFDLFLLELGIQAHYTSISRGVIDARDVFYFITAAAFFLLLSVVRLNSSKLS